MEKTETCNRNVSGSRRFIVVAEYMMYTAHAQQTCNHRPTLPELSDLSAVKVFGGIITKVSIQISQCLFFFLSEVIFETADFGWIITNRQRNLHVLGLFFIAEAFM